MMIMTTMIMTMMMMNLLMRSMMMIMMMIIKHDILSSAKLWHSHDACACVCCDGYVRVWCVLQAADALTEAKLAKDAMLLYLEVCTAYVSCRLISSHAFDVMITMTIFSL